MDFLRSLETDIAYHILSEGGKPIFYKDLIMEVIDKKRKPVQSLSEAIAEVYTHINMDSRFNHTGAGMWGLTEWNPPEVKRSSSSSSTKSKSMTTERREKLLESIQDDMES